MEEIFTEIIDIIEDVADIPSDEIEMDSAIIDDLDLSSLEIMSVVAYIERKYSIKIDQNELLSIRTVGELAELVDAKV